jgi:UDP-N-acetylmuramate dehydrogenase
MKVRENVALSTLTTLKVGAVARYVLSIDSEADIETALAFVRERGLAYVVLGEGSNVLAEDAAYDGAILLMRISGLSFRAEGATALVTAGAGVSWDLLVSECADRALWGIENLAGIPGTVGAAPVQNIGAYGAEMRAALEEVTAYDVRERTYKTFTNAECGFSYRDSRFKHEPELVITSVTLRLATAGVPHVEYADLVALREKGTDLSTPSAIGRAVREVRGRKFPDLREYGTAGSFFKNPIVSEEKYQELAKKYEREAAPYGGIPRYPVPGQVKIPLAFILDKFLGLRGYQLGPAFLFGNQPLVLVAGKGAHASDVDALACDIEARVERATGIRIEREVRFLRAHEARL